MARSGILFFYFIVLAFLLTLLPSRAFADFKLLDAIEELGERRFVKSQPDRLVWKPVRIHPTLRTSVEYDDNILLEKDDPREDVVFNIKPGAVIEVPLGKHQFSSGYEAEFEVFTKNQKQNDQNQAFFSLLDLHFPDWYVNILETLKETSSRAGTTFSNRIPRIDQSVNPKVGYRWKRTIFETGFRHFYRNFRKEGNSAFDFHVLEWTEVVYYDLFARLKALGEYQVANIAYPHNHRRDAIVQQARVGLEGEVHPNVTVKFRIGPQFRNYQYTPKPNFNSWVADLKVNYQVRKNWKLNAEAAREAVEATFGDVNYYKEHAIRLGLEYTFRPQWILYTKGGFARHDYAERATLDNRTAFRRDKLATFEAGLRYLMREWLEFQLAYEYLRRDSNFQPFDYSDNRVSLTSALTY